MGINNLEYEKFVSERCTSTSIAKSSNGIDYIFNIMNDGWVAISEIVEGTKVPVIQAFDISHAESYISLIEPVNIPVNFFK